MEVAFSNLAHSPAVKPRKNPQGAFFHRMMHGPALGLAGGMLMASLSLSPPMFTSCGYYTKQGKSLEIVAKALCVGTGGYNVAIDGSCADCSINRGPRILPYENQPIKVVTLRDFENVNVYGVNNLGYVDSEGKGHLLSYDIVNLFHNTRLMLHCSKLTYTVGVHDKWLVIIVDTDPKVMLQIGKGTDYDFGQGQKVSEDVFAVLGGEGWKVKSIQKGAKQAAHRFEANQNSIDIGDLAHKLMTKPSVHLETERWEAYVSENIYIARPKTLTMAYFIHGMYNVYLENELRGLDRDRCLSDEPGPPNSIFETPGQVKYVFKTYYKSEFQPAISYFEMSKAPRQIPGESYGTFINCPSFIIAAPGPFMKQYCQHLMIVFPNCVVGFAGRNNDDQLHPGIYSDSPKSCKELVSSFEKFFGITTGERSGPSAFMRMLMRNGIDEWWSRNWGWFAIPPGILIALGVFGMILSAKSGNASYQQPNNSNSTQKSKPSDYNDKQTKIDAGYGHMHQQRWAQTMHNTMNRGDSPMLR